jgi:outer membrane protein assembly factor BamD (BamD/ComL family)
MTKKVSPKLRLRIQFSVILLLVSSCGFSGSLTTKETPQEVPPLEWQQIKDKITMENPDDATISTLVKAMNDRKLKIHSNEIDEIISAIKTLKNSTLKNYLINYLSSQLSMLDNADKFLARKLVNSEEYPLPSDALSMIINADLVTNENGQDQWETWEWPEETRLLLENAVDKDLYKLSKIDNGNGLVFLRLINRYPKSKLAEGAREYSRLTGGASYFGPEINQSSAQVSSVLRLPLNPSDEIKVWPIFLQKYPGHPASDDAVYRIARAYEIKGDYGQAALTYYQASNLPDKALLVASSRVLFIVDLLMNSKSVEKLIKNNPYPELTPVFQYSKAIHLVREGDLSLAIKNLEQFINSYENKILIGLVNTGEDPVAITEKSNFWKNIKDQIKNLKELENIRRENISDKQIYKEASFWFNHYLSSYNYFWRSLQTSTFSLFIPDWEGPITSIRWSMRHEFIQNATKGYDSQNGNLTSILLFQKILADYPNSSLAEKAKYSIILNYYWLHQEGWPVSQEQKDSWVEAAVKNVNEFIQQFPQSSMCDDALITIGDIGAPRFQLNALEQIIEDYPNGDRAKEAKELLASLKESLSNSERDDGIITIGAQLDERKSGWNSSVSEVFLTGISSSSSAEKNGLVPNDIILKVDKRKVYTVIDVRAHIRSHEPGESVELEINRDGKIITLNIPTELSQK